jgi:tRNA pseudouridine13 synthase
VYYNFSIRTSKEDETTNETKTFLFHFSPPFKTLGCPFLGIIIQKVYTMQKIFPLDIQNEFHFNSSARDFIVSEIPLYEFSGNGEHLVLHIRKKDLTTWQMLDILSNHIGIKRKEIGYAGLKDKNAMTMQYISIPARLEDKLESFSHPQIKILSSIRHNNKIRVGHLKGNSFKIRLKKVLGVQKDKLDSALKWIESNGVPNYFGHQRFGTDGTNWIDGKKLLEGKLKIRDKKTREFLIGSYQSYLFNKWLSYRVQLSKLLDSFTPSQTQEILKLPQGTLDGVAKQKQFFKLLSGDLMMHYPYGRMFVVEDLANEAIRFQTKDISPTGLLPGKKAKYSLQNAKIIEDMFDEDINVTATRRYAWIFPGNIQGVHIPEKAHYELSFDLPKGSYATNVLDMLRGREEN